MFGKKGKKPKPTTSEQIKPISKKKESEENKDVKEVLQLFNKIEELVVDGDPRIKEALSQKPGIQNLLRDDSSLFGLTPRSMMIPGQATTEIHGLAKETTNISLLSQGRLPNNSKQMQFVDRSVRKNIIVPPIAIPEHSTLGDTFSDGYHAALIKQHPDGTLESTRVEQKAPIISDPIKRRQALPEQPVVTQTTQPVFPVPIQQPRNRLVYKPKQKVKKLEADTLMSPRYHSFTYDDGKEKSIIQIQMGEGALRPNQDGTIMENERKTVPTAFQGDTELDVTEKSQKQLFAPQFHSTFAAEPSAPALQPVMSSKQNQAAVYSKVIGEEGGTLTCFGCKLQVPKNGVEKKWLFRISIMDISQVPHKTDRIFYHTQNYATSVVFPITPAIQISPIDVQQLKPITITLPTCVAVQEQVQTESDQPTTSDDHNDIKADDIMVKLRNKHTKNVWIDTDTEVFRSSDSVIFQMQELGDVCAFYKNDVKVEKTLNKRLAVFLFKSSDDRKKQFVSILISEDLPHVIQKGIEGMPHWLKYTDSCSNITVPEGNNLVIFMEASDRKLCSTDANKIDIPWENLWHPECIIRKHIHVSLMQRDISCFVQVFVNDGKTILNSEFIWKTKHYGIRMPDVMTTGEEGADFSQDDKWHNEYEAERLEQEMLKKVTWKPETPVSKFVTNKGLLSYAAMQ